MLEALQSHILFAGHRIIFKGKKPHKTIWLLRCLVLLQRKACQGIITPRSRESAEGHFPPRSCVSVYVLVSRACHLPGVAYSALMVNFL